MHTKTQKFIWPSTYDLEVVKVHVYAKFYQAKFMSYCVHRETKKLNEDAENNTTVGSKNVQT